MKLQILPSAKCALISSKHKYTQYTVLVQYPDVIPLPHKNNCTYVYFSIWWMVKKSCTNYPPSWIEISPSRLEIVQTSENQNLQNKSCFNFEESLNNRLWWCDWQTTFRLEFLRWLVKISLRWLQPQSTARLLGPWRCRQRAPPDFEWWLFSRMDTGTLAWHRCFFVFN